MYKVSLPCVLGALLSTSIVVPTIAQDAPVDAAPAYVAPELYSPNWSDKGIAAIAEQLSGTWTTDAAQGDDSIAMAIAPVAIEGMSDTLYAESVRTSTAWEPYRQAIFQLYRYKGEIRLRTYDFATGSVSKGVYAGMWAATEMFPEISRNELIATLDVELQSTSTGFTGATPYPYPTGVAGAVEMTSSITLDGDTLSVADRGFDADGNVVWGADADSVVSFVRSDPYADVNRRDDGMVIVDYGPAGGIVPQNGDQLHVHYHGYLGDGTRFDSSYARDQAFIFEFPPGNRAITGWGIGMEEFAMGSHRKLIIPGYLAYMERGNPRANIGPNETLYFNVFMAHIDRIEVDPNAVPTSTPAAAPRKSSTAPGHEGHNHD